MNTINLLAATRMAFVIRQFQANGRLSSQMGGWFWFGAVIVFALSIIVFGPIISQFIYLWDSDYPSHIQKAQEIARTGEINLPHIFYHLSVITVNKILFSTSFEDAGILVELFVRALFSLTIYVVLWRSQPATTTPFVRTALSGLLALALSLITPINILSWPEGSNLYLGGYLGSNVYHNPTVELLKPFALLVFVYSVPRLISDQPNSRSATVTTAALMVLSTVSKPNYTIVILPLVVFVTAIRFLIRKNIDWKFLIFGFLAPAALLLGWQYFLLNDLSRGIALGLFRVYDFKVGHFLLTILFPLVVYILYLRRAYRSKKLNLAWLAFFIAISYLFLFYEDGARRHLNFMWGASVTQIILHIATMSFLLKQRSLNWHPQYLSFDWRFIISIVIFGLHLVSGVFWYYLHMFGMWKQWW